MIAVAFVLSATLLAGCRGGSNTDTTTIPTEITSHTVPSQNGVRGQIGASRNHQIQNSPVDSHVAQQYN